MCHASRPLTPAEEETVKARLPDTPGVMAWEPEKESEWFRAMLAPPCGLPQNVYDRSVRTRVRTLRGKQPMNAVNAFKTATKGVVSLASRELKAIAVQMQKAGVLLLVTTQVRCSRVRTLVLLLLPVVEASYAPKEFLQKYDVTPTQWNARCSLDAAPSNLLDAPRRTRASRQHKKAVTVQEEVDASSEEV